MGMHVNVETFLFRLMEFSGIDLYFFFHIFCFVVRLEMENICAHILFRHFPLHPTAFPSGSNAGNGENVVRMAARRKARKRLPKTQTKTESNDKTTQRQSKKKRIHEVRRNEGKQIRIPFDRRRLYVYVAQ